MILEKYSNRWADDFTKIVSEFDKGLDGLVYTIEHVGSTADLICYETLFEFRSKDQALTI
ncbi:MAG: GrpB family protein [Saprospiraceae bacterium]|nr:GrpB family protein [Saprospiraceae bacterium]MBP6566690.1 GrpB family protein [Saprospiraceae bacterium]